MVKAKDLGPWVHFQSVKAFFDICETHEAVAQHKKLFTVFGGFFQNIDTNMKDNKVRDETNELRSIHIHGWICIHFPLYLCCIYEWMREIRPFLRDIPKNASKMPLIYVLVITLRCLGVVAASACRLLLKRSYWCMSYKEALFNQHHTWNSVFVKYAKRNENEKSAAVHRQKSVVDSDAW